MQDEAEKTQFACILSYITLLIKFRKILESFQWKTNPNYDQERSKFMIPNVIFHRFLSMFLDPASNAVSSEKTELLICYILVLTLHADNFRTKPADIQKDLGMTAASLKPFFLQLGCEPYSEGPFQKSIMTLPVPLVFKELKKRVRR